MIQVDQMREANRAHEAQLHSTAIALYGLLSRGENVDEERQEVLIDEIANACAPTSEEILGDTAVQYNVVQTAAIIKDGIPNKLGAKLIASARASARDRLHGVDDEDRLRIEYRMGLREMPTFLLNIVDIGTSQTAVIDRLTQKDEKGAYVVPDDTFQNILEWHNYSMIKRAKAFEVERWSDLKDRYIRHLRLGVVMGWIPEDAMSAGRLKRLDKVKIIVDDGLGMYEGKMLGAMNHHDAASDAEVYIPEDVTQSTVNHELSHILEGYQTDKKLKRADMVYETEFGLNRLFGCARERAGARINEAVTEHIAQTMVQGNPELIDPDQKPGSYELERKLLDTLCNKGIQEIDVRLFISAYFEDTTQKKKGAAMKQLKREIRKAFPGEQVITTLGVICRHEKKHDDVDEDLERYIEALSAKMARIKRLSRRPTLMNKLVAHELKYNKKHRIKV